MWKRSLGLILCYVFREMWELHKQIHAHTLTGFVLEPYWAVKLNWLTQTTALNPNTYVCKWDVMVSAYTMSWLNSSFPELPAGSLRVFHTAWARSIASSMEPATHRQDLFNSLGFGKICPTLRPLIRVNGLPGRSLRRFCWAKWKFLFSFDQSMKSLKSRVPLLNGRNWSWLQVTDSFHDLIKFTLLVQQIRKKVRGNSWSANRINQLEGNVYELRVRRRRLLYCREPFIVPALQVWET